MNPEKEVEEEGATLERSILRCLNACDPRKYLIFERQARYSRD